MHFPFNWLGENVFLGCKEIIKVRKLSTVLSTVKWRVNVPVSIHSERILRMPRVIFCSFVVCQFETFSSSFLSSIRVPFQLTKWWVQSTWFLNLFMTRVLPAPQRKSSSPSWTRSHTRQRQRKLKEKERGTWWIRGKKNQWNFEEQKKWILISWRCITLTGLVGNRWRNGFVRPFKSHPIKWNLIDLFPQHFSND